ncbi:hypothetical protein EAS61_35775 [Bradyrhizobium zhanjiangense]|uniref:Uncharacterized protein n=1 Tax=Bradyrhizobium zhanjiangense TaxID=1325107 RepID=A0A4Q0Q854_9BRAD|nr:hypothetical protein EAS61_35775 [Bradyrhizobium zhanjiangense]
MTASEVEEVAWMLELLRKSSNAAFPRQKLLALLEVIGASQIEGDVREAERLYYRGQAAVLSHQVSAWAHFPDLKLAEARAD